MGQYRVVSAGMKVVYTGQTQTDGGVLCSFLLPPEMYLNTADGLTATGYGVAVFNTIESLPLSRIAPLRDGCFIHYAPQGPRDFFTEPCTTASAGARTLAASHTTMGILVGGATPNTTVAFMDVIINVEYTPQAQFPSSGFSAPANQSFLNAAISWGSSVSNLIAGAAENYLYSTAATAAAALAGAALSRTNRRVGGPPRIGR